MPRWRRIFSLLIVATAFCLAPLPAACAASELAAPQDPLRSSFGLSLGVHILDNEHYQSFFDEDFLSAWTLRYDYRAWRFLRFGVALTASSKSHLDTEISFGSEAYPIRYSFSACQQTAELYLRSELPSLLRLHPHISFGGLASRIHAESWGYSNGYDAIWEDYRPAPEVIQTSFGWRVALGLQWHIWANVNLLLEGSRSELPAYEEPDEQDPPVGLWDHSGWRIEAGFLQRF